MSQEPVFVVESDGTTFAVWEDRVEVTVKKRSQVVPMSDIAEIEVSRRPRKLVIVTRGGKHYQYLLGGEIEAARRAIEAQVAKLRSQPA
ncbi:MAG: hypothetical protein IT303_15610 [Dehalococcoidia bacterium]|nr:hypothetical protein [Dehalococcoidia bacterium]